MYIYWNVLKYVTMYSILKIFIKFFEKFFIRVSLYKFKIEF